MLCPSTILHSRRVNQDVRCYVPQEHSRQRHRPQFKYCQCCVDSLRIAPTLHAWELFLFFTVPSPMHSCAFIVAWIARAFFVEREVVQGWVLVGMSMCVCKHACHLSVSCVWGRSSLEGNRVIGHATLRLKRHTGRCVFVHPEACRVRCEQRRTKKRLTECAASKLLTKRYAVRMTGQERRIRGRSNTKICHMWTQCQSFL